MKAQGNIHAQKTIKNNISFYSELIIRLSSNLLNGKEMHENRTNLQRPGDIFFLFGIFIAVLMFYFFLALPC